jgi:hypothetical protein
MNQKEILTVGLISAFVFAATIAVIPAEADNSIGVSDDDSLAQDNSAKIPQDADNDVVISGIGNTGTAGSSQAASSTQSNTLTDNDVKTVTPAQTDSGFEAGGDIALPLP